MINLNNHLHREELLHEKPNINGLLNILICPICCDILHDAVMERKNQHTFCLKCAKDKGLDTCPICREPAEFEKAYFANSVVELLRYKCPYHVNGCQFLGSFDQLEKHCKSCEPFLKIHLEKLDTIVKEMKSILDQEINNHLKEKHLELFQNDINEWKFLGIEDQQWNWWSWEHNEKTKCEVCQQLNHMVYGHKLWQLDRQRRQLIGVINEDSLQKKNINECVVQIQTTLDEINPHIIEKHFQIYNNYVKDWEFLYTLDEQWAWWWFCNQPWWQGQKCAICQVFFSQYENHINSIDNIRRTNLQNLE